jgi:PAS domain S-box-containing protein
MTDPARSPRRLLSALLPFATAALATATFVVDALTPPEIAVAALYAVVVLMASHFCRPGGVVLVAAACAGLTTVAALVTSESYISATCNIAAIAGTTVLAVNGQSSEFKLQGQANLLDLTHDAIFVRGMDDVISFWNRGAEQLYGWTPDEAVGRNSHQHLQTVFPAPIEQIKDELLRTGRWEGELIHTKRDGMRVTASSRWSLERDKYGRPLRVLETNNDITGRKRAEMLAARMFECVPDGVSIIGRDYRYQRVNPVYERYRGIPPERVVGRHVAELFGEEYFEQTAKPNLDRCLAGEDVRFARWYASPHGQLYLAVTYSPVRLGTEQVEAALVVTRDLTEFMRTSDELREAEADLAHVNRLTTMGQLTAAISHEVTQPIAATIANAQAALHWVNHEAPDLDEVRMALGRIVENGQRAGDVIDRIRPWSRRCSRARIGSISTKPFATSSP